jgi:hypothetical protein
MPQANQPLVANAQPNPEPFGGLVWADPHLVRPQQFHSGLLIRKMEKAKAAKRKAIGPSSNPLMGFRADEITRAAIVKWAENQPDKPTLSEAVRRLVGLGLSGNGRPNQVSQVRANEAKVMAADQLDRLADPFATTDEQAVRKRRLLQGPEEFQNVRVDRLKKKQT